MSSFPNEDGTMETVMKNIYSSCDPENSNLVPASKIIDFIAPYMLEDPIALDSLKTALDPTNGNVCVSSEQFYEIMNEWTKQIVNSSENDADKDFNRTPSQLDQIDEKQLPYTQSTPRASFGQKLLSCEGLLNLSNVSTYSLSTSVHTKEKTAAEKTILEEEIKRLEHHLNKLANELVVVKLQLTTTEEQNEILQSDLDRCKTRLQSEQQVIEHLQNDKRYNDELRDEVNSSKKLIEDLTKKLLQYEKDSHHLYSLMEHIEKENSNLEHRCEELSRREQQAKKQIIDIKTELDLKDQEINTILKVNDELKNKLNQQKDLLDQLSNENELLDHEKSTLEKALRNNLSARRDSIVSQYQTCLADSKNFLGLDESGEEESCFKIQDTDNALYNSLQAEFSQVSFGSKSSHSDIGFSNKSQPEVNIVKDCFDCLHHLKEIKQLQSKNEDIQSKLQLAENENDQLRLQITEMEHKVLTLGQDINNLRIEKNDKEDALTKIKEDKSVLLKEKKELEKMISDLRDENNNLSESNKTVNSILESKNKLVAELDEKLLCLKRDYTDLQMDSICKEKQLCEYKNKFDFEAAFRKLQIEVNEKNGEISKLKTHNEELKESLANMIDINNKLQTSLNNAEQNLEEYQKQSKEMLNLNENIEFTASQVQHHLDKKNAMINELVDLNKKFEQNISNLEEDLKDKIKAVTDLRDCLKSDMDIKNILWRDNKELSNSNKKLLEELQGLKDKRRDDKEEYNILMTNYNREEERNSELCQQISTLNVKLSSVEEKYEEETKKNDKINEEFATVKADFESIMRRQTEINLRLCDYEKLNVSLQRNLEEALKDNEKLKGELEAEKNKHKKLFDIDITPSEGSRNMSFERQQISIERLKEKLEMVVQDEKLAKEKLKQVIQEEETLQERYVKIQSNLESERAEHLSEKESFQNIIRELSDKLKATEDNQTELKRLLTEKEEAFSLQLSLLEQQNKELYAELENKNILINSIRNENETYKGLISNADRNTQDTLSKLSACLYKIQEKENAVQLLHAENAEKNNKVMYLMSRIADLQTEVTKIRADLSKKNDTIIDLEDQNKCLQEMLSKSDDLKKHELINTEEKLKDTNRILRESENELGSVQNSIAHATEELDRISDDVAIYKNVINDGRRELTRVSHLVLRNWQGFKADAYDRINFLIDGKVELEEGKELLKLNDTIKFAVFILETLANKAPLSMENREYGITGILNTENNALDGKNIQKFTLRPPRVITSRPASPDSPSIDLEGDESNKIQEIYSSPSKRRLNQGTESCIPDVSYNDESFKTACENLSFSQNVFETQDVFPNITDSFLEKLGLHESSPKQILSKEETERIFTTFAIQIALDSKDIKERLQKQKDQCTEQYEQFLSVVRDICNRLRDHRCIGASDCISPVFILLEDLKYFLKDLTQASGQLGILMCENRMMRCWNLATNYMALLKQETVKLELGQTAESQIQCNTETKVSPYLRKRLKNLNVDESNDKNDRVVKHDVEQDDFRCRYLPTCRTATALITLALLFIFMLIVLAHWQCRMTVPETQVCVLDDFIKKFKLVIHLIEY